MIIPAIILMRPSALLWALAAGLVVVFYLRSIRPPQMVMARPHLWREVLGEPRSSTSLWRRRRLTSGAIHVGIVLLLALAAADPCLHRPRTVVFVIDNSRSMEAAEAGTTRLAKTRALLAKYLETIGPREYAAIVTTAGQPVVLSPAEQSLARVADAIQRIRTTDLPSHVTEALDIAARQAARGTLLQVHLLSDGCFEGSDSANLQAKVVVDPVGDAAGNAAITRLAARRYPDEPRRFQVMVEVTNENDAALTAPVRILLDDRPIHQVELQADANSTSTLVANLESETGGTLLALLETSDSLPDDNRLETMLPSAAAGSPSEPFPEPAIATRNACETRSPTRWCAEPSPADRYWIFPLWPWIVLAATLLLAAEWAMYHQRWTA